MLLSYAPMSQPLLPVLLFNSDKKRLRIKGEGNRNGIAFIKYLVVKEDGNSYQL